MTERPPPADAGLLMPSPPSSSSAPAPFRGAVATCWIGLFNIGVYTALLGPVMPEFAERTGASLGAAGAVVTALAGAAIVSTLTAGRSIDRYGTRLPLTVALIVNGAALALLPWATSWPMLLALGALLGVGDGGIAVATHVLVGQANEGDEAAALNRLNVFFGVGAVFGPVAAALVRAMDGRVVLLLAAVGVAQWIGAATLLRLRLSVPPARRARSAEEASDSSVLRSGRLWLFSALLLVYVGLELGLGAWAFTYARESAGMGGAAAALLSGGFWAALTLSRLLSPVFLRGVSPPALLVLSACVAAGGMLVLLAGGSAPPPLAAGVLIVGFGFGPVWPVVFALAARTFPAAMGTASGVLAMASATGAAGLPLLLGAVLDRSGPAALIAATFTGSLLLLVLAIGAARWVRGTPAAL